MIDLDAERTLTPGCQDAVFLDSAGSSLPPVPVVEATIAHLRREAEVGGYRAAAERADDLARLPGALADLIGGRADGIALTDSATRAWNQVVTALPWRAGDRILICGNEYASNAIALLQRARHDGCSVEVVPSTAAGEVDLDALDAMLDERVRLVSVVHVATNSGRITEVRGIADRAHRVGALVVLDACQSVGQLDLDVTALGVDALTGTGRKWLRGPRGTGFLYLDPAVAAALEPTALDLRGAVWSGPADYEVVPGAARFELWENNIAARLGLLAAVDQLRRLGPAEVETAVRSGAAALRSGLSEVPGVRVRDVGAEQSGIVSFTVDHRDPAQVRARLLEHGVTVSVSEAGSTRVDMEARGLDAVVRASPHYFVSPEQLAQAVDAVAAIAGGPA